MEAAIDLGDAYGPDDKANEFRFPECPWCRSKGLKTKLVRRFDGVHCPVCPDPRPMQMFQVNAP